MIRDSPSKLKIKQNFSFFNSPQFPSNIRIISTFELNKGNRIRLGYFANNSFLILHIICNIFIWKNYPLSCTWFKLSYFYCWFGVRYHKDIFWDLIHYFERFFDGCWWEFEFLQYLFSFEILLDADIISLLSAYKHIIELKIENPTNNPKLLLDMWSILIKINPLKLNNRSIISPLGRYLRIKPKLLNSNRIKLIIIFSRDCIDIHPYFKIITHLINTIDRFCCFLCCILLILFLCLLYITLLHLFTSVGEFDHYLF